MTGYLHYDVFTNQPFEGNQLAVFTDARGMSAERMQTITREMNFSESTFLLPAETPGTDIRMRIFTPGAELPMAGHPTIGSTFALADTGVIPPGTRAVRVRARRRTDAGRARPGAGQRLEFAWMDQQTPVLRDPASPVADILTAIGCVDRRCGSRGACPSRRSPAVCRSSTCRSPPAQAVDAAEPDLRALRALRSAFPGRAQRGVPVRGGAATAAT